MPLQARANQLKRDLSLIWEKRAALLYDTANQIAPGGLSAQGLRDRELRERYLRLAHPNPDGDPAPSPSTTPPCNREGLAQHLHTDSDTDCILLCRILAHMAGLSSPDQALSPLITALFPGSEEDSASDISESDIPPGYEPRYDTEEDYLSLPLRRRIEEELDTREDDGNRVIYLRSSYTDDAYLRFSEVVPELRADYAGSFASVCEAVYYNPSSLCILPLENTTDGSLTSFRSLIARHGLKIICTCDVQSGEEQLTRFALLKRSLSLIPGQRTDAPERFLRFVLYSGGEVSLARALHAAEACHLPLYKTDTVPTSYGRDSFAYDVTLRIGPDLPTFLIWLSLEAPESEIVGIYPHWGAQD